MKNSMETEQAVSEFTVGLEVPQIQSFGPSLFYIFNSDFDYIKLKFADYTYSGHEIIRHSKNRRVS